MGDVPANIDSPTRSKYSEPILEDLIEAPQCFFSLIGRISDLFKSNRPEEGLRLLETLRLQIFCFGERLERLAGEIERDSQEIRNLRGKVGLLERLNTEVGPLAERPDC